MKNLKYNLIWSYWRVKSGFKKTIGKEHLPEVMKKFKKEFKEIDARKKKEKGVMAFHRSHLMLGLAIYHTLKDRYSKEEIIEIIHEILWHSSIGIQLRFVGFLVRKSKNPYDTFLKQLGPNNDWFFPCPPWEKERVEIENGIGWYQKKCPMFDFFEDEGHWELCRAVGDLDLKIAALASNHIKLKREKAMCWGDDYCDFLYYRK